MTNDEIEDRIKNPAFYGIAKIRVLRDKLNRLPVNKQVGATCGIYALQAALQMQGDKIAPRKQVFGDWRSNPGILRKGSIRGMAKEMGLTKIGEIGGAADLVALAGGLGVGAKTKTERFSSKDELWTLIRDAIDAGKGIVMPYACAGDDGAPAWSVGADGFAHWCLLFGYAEYKKDWGAPRVFMTTYGNYLAVSPYELFKANQRIQDWPRQNWIKLTVWQKEPNRPDWERLEDCWQAEATLQKDLGERAELFGALGWGFGIGDPKQVLHKVADPPSPTLNLNIPTAKLQKAILKSADLQKVEYTKTMCGQCVVV
jgi:hypothetical protein